MSCSRFVSFVPLPICSLLSQGVHEGQGYLFGRPMMSDAILERLAVQKPSEQKVA